MIRPLGRLGADPYAAINGRSSTDLPAMRNGSGCGCPLRDVADGFAEVPAGKVELVGLLQIHPKIRCGSKVAGETQGGVGRDGPPAGDDLRDAVGRDFERTG